MTQRARIAFRCDGGATVGAGHVGRCLPIARALEDQGAEVVFVGAFDGIAAWLLERSGLDARPARDGPCGLAASDWTGAVVDLYLPGGQPEICELAGSLPVATPGEATRCRTSGLWIDYHLGAAPGVTERRLGGPDFVPLDPRFAAGRHPRSSVERILVVAGASSGLATAAGRLAEAAALAFPQAEVLAPAPVASQANVTPLPTPTDLAELAPTIDLAVTAAGMTAYELASAGIPLLAVALAENQRVVIEGCAQAGIALTVDGIDTDPLPASISALERLKDPSLRAALSDAATENLDGQGAGRIAKALLTSWTDRGTAHSAG